MEEMREILTTRIFTFAEILDTLVEGKGKLESFELSLPGRDGNLEYRKFVIQRDKPFIRVRFTEPIEKK